MAVVIKPMVHFVFDVFVKEQPEGLPSLPERVQRRGFLGFIRGLSMAILDPLHLLGIAVIVRKGFIDIGNVEVVFLGDFLRRQSALFDPVVHVSNRDTAPLDVGLLVDLRIFGGNDPILLGRHRSIIVSGTPSINLLTT